MPHQQHPQRPATTRELPDTQKSIQGLQPHAGTGICGRGDTDLPVPPLRAHLAESIEAVHGWNRREPMKTPQLPGAAVIPNSSQRASVEGAPVKLA